MSRHMLPETIWHDIGDALVAVDGEARAFRRVMFKALPAFALGFVKGGAA